MTAQTDPRRSVVSAKPSSQQGIVWQPGSRSSSFLPSLNPSLDSKAFKMRNHLQKSGTITSRVASAPSEHLAIDVLMKVHWSGPDLEP